MVTKQGKQVEENKYIVVQKPLTEEETKFEETK